MGFRNVKDMNQRADPESLHSPNDILDALARDNRITYESLDSRGLSYFMRAADATKVKMLNVTYAGETDVIDSIVVEIDNIPRFSWLSRPVPDVEGLISVSAVDRKDGHWWFTDRDHVPPIDDYLSTRYGIDGAKEYGFHVIPSTTGGRAFRHEALLDLMQGEGPEATRSFLQLAVQGELLFIAEMEAVAEREEKKRTI